VELQLKQRLGAFLLRHGKRDTAGKSKWTQRFYRWLSEVQMEYPVQQMVLEEYVDAVKQAEARLRGFEQELLRALESWSLRPVVDSLKALRGVNFVTRLRRSIRIVLPDVHGKLSCPGRGCPPKRGKRSAVTQQQVATAASRLGLSAP